MRWIFRPVPAHIIALSDIDTIGRVNGFLGLVFLRLHMQNGLLPGFDRFLRATDFLAKAVGLIANSRPTSTDSPFLGTKRDYQQL